MKPLRIYPRRGSASWPKESTSGGLNPVIFLQNQGPFLWPVLWNPAHRRELLQWGWNDVGKVFLLATILDVVYQLIVLRGVYVQELLTTAVTLAIVHYVLLRDPLRRITRVVLAARPSVKTTLDPDK